MSWEIIVEGHVQGVNFRQYVYDLAISKGVNGYVQNLNDGTVKIITDKTDFIDELINAPSPKRVDKIMIIKSKEPLSEFFIKR